MLEYVSHWVTTVNRTKASLPVQERLRYLRLFTIRHVYDAIARAAGLPEGQSRNIEDLRDLERFDDAIQGIADRQRTLEESQQKARQAWRDLDARVRTLEGQARSTSVEPARPPAAEKAGARPDAISTAQRGHIYDTLLRLQPRSFLQLPASHSRRGLARVQATTLARHNRVTIPWFR